MGKLIQDIQQLYNGLGTVFTSLDQNSAVNKVVLNSEIVIQMKYSDPDGVIVIDASGDKVEVYTGECPAGVEPKVTLKLTADTAHRYWLGKVNFMMAMQKGEIKTDGDLGLVLKLVPVLGPLFKVYADYLRDNGMTDLLI